MFLGGPADLPSVLSQSLSDDDLPNFEAVLPERQGYSPRQHKSLLVRLQNHGIDDGRDFLLLTAI